MADSSSSRGSDFEIESDSDIDNQQPPGATG